MWEAKTLFFSLRINNHKNINFSLIYLSEQKDNNDIFIKNIAIEKKNHQVYINDIWHIEIEIECIISFGLFDMNYFKNTRNAM